MTDSNLSKRGTQPAAKPIIANTIATAPKPMGKGWDRTQVTVKLTARRKSILSDIALGMPNGTTPNDAIGRALEMAWISHGDMESIVERMDALEDTIEAGDGERRRESERMLAAITEIREGLARLHRFLSEIADEA